MFMLHYYTSSEVFVHFKEVYFSSYSNGVRTENAALTTKFEDLFKNGKFKHSDQMPTNDAIALVRDFTVY